MSFLDTFMAAIIATGSLPWSFSTAITASAGVG